MGSSQASVRVFWWCLTFSSRERRSFSSKSQTSSGDIWRSSKLPRPTLGVGCTCWCWGAFRQCHLLSGRGWATHFHLLWAAFSCYPGCSGRKLPKYHSCCSGNCWWQCCALQSINGTGESLYPARLPILSPEVQCPVSRYSTSFQSCAPLLPCTGASPESDSCFTGRAQKLSLRQWRCHNS